MLMQNLAASSSPLDNANGGWMQTIGGVGHKGINKIAWAARILTSDVCSLARICRMAISVFSVIEYCSGRPGLFSAVNLSTIETTLYTFNSLEPIAYFWNRNDQNKSTCDVLANGFLLVSGVAGFLSLLDEAALIRLSNSAFPALGAVISPVASGFMTLGFVCWGIDAARNLNRSDTIEEKTKHMLFLTWCVSQVALGVILTAGVGNAVFIGVVGTFATSLGTAVFLYSNYLNEKKNQEPYSIKSIV